MILRYKSQSVELTASGLSQLDIRSDDCETIVGAFGNLVEKIYLEHEIDLGEYITEQGELNDLIQGLTDQKQFKHVEMSHEYDFTIEVVQE